MLPAASSHTELLNCPILIVEDNEANRLYLTRALESRGLNNLMAVESGEAAMRCMDDFAPELVILDLMMPGMDGFECSRAIRGHPQYHDLPILVQTSANEPQIRYKAFEMGATDFIHKPIYADELYARVRVHLQNRLYVKNLQHYKSRVSDELASAQQLQYSILPTSAEIDNACKESVLDIASYFKPSSEIGGDFWGIKSLPDHMLSLWMVDFSGHGVAAALNAFRLQAYLKEHSGIALEPGQYLSQLNEKLLRLLMRGQFATMFYALADTRRSSISYACACTPHPLFYNAKTHTASMLNGSGSPLGIAPQQYATQQQPFLPGDILVLYSDALIETPTAQAAGLDEKALLTLLRQHQHKSADEIKTAFLDYFNHHTTGMLSDDLTLFICKRMAA